MKLFNSFPDFQVEFGQTAIFPLVKASSFGILGLESDILVITSILNSDDRKLVYKVDTGMPIVWDIYQWRNIVFNNPISSVSQITEFSLAYSLCVQPGHLEQLAFACPNLQRLNLQDNRDCLARLQGLRTIAGNCRDLRGLNIQCIPVTKVENYLGLWEIISNMKLTHLVLDNCTLNNNYVNLYKEKLIVLFQKCTNLQALQLEASDCSVCDEGDTKWSMLAHFPSLRYCRLVGDHMYVVQDVISSCGNLNVLSCVSSCCLMLSAVYTSSLQQLHIGSPETNIPDIFMDRVSCHGGLIHVVLSVNSVSVEGICCLIMNSPSLLTLKIHLVQLVCENSPNGIHSMLNLHKRLEKRFPHRKLFTAGAWNCIVVKTGECDFSLPGTDVFPLWPLSKHFHCNFLLLLFYY